MSLSSRVRSEDCHCGAQPHGLDNTTLPPHLGTDRVLVLKKVSGDEATNCLGLVERQVLTHPSYRAGRHGIPPD